MMTRRFIVRPVAYAMILWLALHGLTAWTMTLCKHVQAAQSVAVEGSDHCQHGAQPAGCEDCAVCHLAGAPALPAGLLAPAVAAPAIYVTLPATQPDSHTPERSHPPPLPPRA